MMTLEEEGAYCRLLWFCWQHGSVPSDPIMAARLIGKGCSIQTAEVVLTMFVPAPEAGRLVHERLEYERRKQENWRLKSKKGGLQSVAAKALVKGGSKMVGTKRQLSCLQSPVSSLQSPSSSPSPSPSSTPVKTHERESGGESFCERPSRKEVEDRAEIIGLAKWKAGDWFDEMEGCGWLDFQHRPVKRWQAILNRVKAKWEADGRPTQPPGQKGAQGAKSKDKPDSFADQGDNW